MAAVVFAFGARPGVTCDEALAIADALSSRRNFFALSARTKIRDQAEKDPDRETSEDVVLLDGELAALHEVLVEPIVGPEDSDAVKRLAGEVAAEIARRGPSRT